MKKIIAVALAAVMVLGMSAMTMGASITINSTATPGTNVTDTTEYTYYKILDASIETAPTVGLDGNTTNLDATKVSYYVTTEAKKAALENLKVGEGDAAKPIFNVVKDATQDKWYVELNKDTNASAEQIAKALDSVKTTFADASGTFAQTTPGGTAKADELTDGYYLITSTLGDKLVVQTLADITINTKNSYPGSDKTIATSDVNAQIGTNVHYTLKVDVPATANDKIVLTDTMNAGLTFVSIDSVKNTDNANVAYTLNPTAPAATDKVFTITFDKDVVVANKGKTITIEYTAMINKDAAIDTGIPNTLDLKYGNNYSSVTKTIDTSTHSFEFDKVDGSAVTTKLVGAEFELQLDGAALELVEVEAGKLYRIATDEDPASTKITKITTNGNRVKINGLDTDLKYQLVETKAPTGYNLLEKPIEVKVEDNAFVYTSALNNKGSVLPSTGGIGTTIFYALGAILVLGGGILLVSKRRAA